ncbi:MAG: hypothetical protein Q7R34_06555, partial [Dehalococcoidia bacterium]|nr:hypothetical protein [Dehalococcoidia bacterium]
VPVKESSAGEQMALAIALLVIKPLYTLIAALLIVAMWRLKSRDMVALRLGVIAFLVGEMFCAVNIVLFGDASFLLEALHSAGMATSFGLATYAVMDGLDTRVLNYSSPNKRCAVLGLCRQCIKYTDAPCGLTRLFYFLTPSLVVLAFIPLLVGTNPVSYNTSIFGVRYELSHPVRVQVLETRYFPILAIFLLAASLLFLLLNKNNKTELYKILFSAGTGFLGFGFFRLIFFGVYRDNLVWPNFWEELTELMYMAGIGFVLFIFRHSLLATGKTYDPAGDVQEGKKITDRVS